MHFVKCKWYEPFECVNVLWACPKMKPLPQLNKLIKCFDKIIKNVGVNRAPAWIRQPGRDGDSGRDTFENKNLITRKIKRNKTERPRGFGSDSPTGSDRARGSPQLYWYQSLGLGGSTK